jgi:3-dehydroquinate synthase
MSLSSSLETVRVELGARAYNILVGHGALAELGPRLSLMLKRPRAFVLTEDDGPAFRAELAGHVRDGATVRDG